MQLSELMEEEIHVHTALLLASPEHCESQEDILGGIWVQLDGVSGRRQHIASNLYLEHTHPCGDVHRASECE